MALELKISAGNAKQTLLDVAEAANKLKTALDGMPQATRFNNLVNALANLKGVDGKVITDLNELGNAVNRLAAAKDLGAVAKGLAAIGRLDISKVAANVQQLNAALKGLVVPPGLANAATALNNFAGAASKANAQARQLGATLKNIKPPSNLTASVSQINRLSAAMQQGSGSARMFGTSLGGLTGILSGFGIALGGVGFARFLQGLSGTERQLASFGAITNSVMGDAGGAAQSMDFLRDTAYNLGLPLRELVDTFPKFAASLRMAGQDGATTQKIYKDLSIALAGVGADAIKTQRAFKAVEQMFNKGQVMAEELKQQLGDAVPGAVAAFAKSMNVGTKELLKMMEAGQVGSDRIADFAALLAKEAGPAAEAMAKTWVGAANNMSSAWMELQGAVSGSFFEALTPSVNGLVEAMKNFVSSGTAAAWGTALGTIASGVTDVATAIMNLMSGPLGGIVSVIGGVAAVALSLGIAFKGVSAAASLFGLSGLTPLIGLLGKAGLAIVGLVGSMGGVGLAIAGVTAAIAIAVAAYRGLSGETETAAQKAEKFYGASQQVSGEVDTLAEALHVAKNAQTDMGISSEFLAGAQNILAAQLGVVQAEMAALAAKFAEGQMSAKEHAKALEELQARWEFLQQQMQNVARRAEDLKKGMQDAAAGTNSAGSAADSTSAKMRSMGSSMSSATSQARSLESALQSLASTQRQVESSTTTVTSRGDSTTSSDSSYRDTGPLGFEGSMFDQGSLFSGGGISHKGTGDKWRNLPAALWKGAPKLAGGIENTNQILGAGGIPAILHPNEAVVPLTGGGSIPIAGDVGGGGAGMQVVAGAISQLLTVNLSTKTEVTRVKEAVNANTAVLKNAIDKVNMTLMAVASGVASLRSSGGFGGGVSSGGGGSSYGGYTGSGGTGGNMGTAGVYAGGIGGSGALFDLGKQYDDLEAQRSQISDQIQGIWQSRPWFQYGTGNGQKMLMNPGDRQAVSDLNSQSAALSNKQMDLLWADPNLAAAFFTEKAKNASGVKATQYRNMAKMFQQGAKSGKRLQMNYMTGDAYDPSAMQQGMYFAKGSPNASRDPNGGFRATLHPNEAVIPLPDGRTVPMKLPEELTNVMQKLEMDYRGSGTSSVVERGTGRSGSSGGGGGNVINIQMHIETPDAASFSKSRAQIMQEFKSEFDRVAARYGSADRREDPTRRTKR